MAQQVLDAVPQGGGRRGAARAGALHVEVDDPVLEAAERDVAAVIGDSRPHAGLDQILDLRHRLGVLGIEELVGCLGRRARAHDRRARHEMLHDGAEQDGLELLPFAVGLGDGDEIGAEEDAADAVDLEQPRRERRLLGLRLVAHVERSLGQHGAAGQEFQRGGIGRCLGLDEHDALLGSPRVQGTRGRSNMAFNALIGSFRPPGQRSWAGCFGAGRLSSSQLMASRSSSVRWPGTIAIGIGKLPAVLPSVETSGPGPSLSAAAASTSTEISSSSSMRLRISSAVSPSRITCSGVMPAMPLARALMRASIACASSCASARMMSATPSHCWLRSWVSITRSMMTLTPTRAARRLAK